MESERFKTYDYDDLATRDKANLDLTFLKDDSLTDTASLPAPEVLVREIIDDRQAALAEFQAIGAALGLGADELEADELRTT